MLSEFTETVWFGPVTALVILVAALVLARISAPLLDRLQNRLLGRTATTLDDAILEAVRGPLRAVIIIAGSQLALAQIEQTPESWREGIASFFFVLYLLLVFVAAYRVIGGLVSWYGQEVVYETETDLDDKFLSFFRRLAVAVLAIIMIVILLGRFGIELSALVTTLGIGSLAIALAAQETLGDIISGFMIMIDQPFSVGDRIEILDIDTWGDVTEIGLRSTRIMTRDNRMVAIPNSVIGKGLVVNYSDPSTVYRVQTHIGLAYGTDVEAARELMVEAIRAEDWVMKERPVEALLLEFRDSDLYFRVRCWIENYVETRRVIDKMNSALYHALTKANVKFAFPHRDVRLISTEPAPDGDPLKAMIASQDTEASSPE